MSTLTLSDPATDTDTFEYDLASRMTSAESERYNNTVNFAYNDDHTLASESLTIQGQTYTVGRSYDAADRLTGITYPDTAW